MNTKNLNPNETTVVHGGVQFDRWILGVAPDSAAEYVMHLAQPMFLAKFWDGEDDDPEAPDTLSAFSVSVGDTTFYDVMWFDDPPESDDDVLALFQQADEAITRYTLKD